MYPLTSITWPYYGLRRRPIEFEFFWKLSADKLLVFKWSPAQVYFFEKFICNMLCLCHYGTELLTFWFETNLGRENSASYLKIQAGKTSSFHGHALVALCVQFLCSDWSKFDRWVHADNLCSILKLVYFDSWSWQSFVSTCDVFNTGCAKWNTAAIKSLLLFMAGLFIGFLVEKCVAYQSRKSDVGWHRFRFSPCFMRLLKRVQKSQAILALLYSFQGLHLEW